MTIRILVVEREVYELDESLGIQFDVPDNVLECWRAAIKAYETTQEEIDRVYRSGTGLGAILFESKSHKPLVENHPDPGFPIPEIP